MPLCLFLTWTMKRTDFSLDRGSLREGLSRPLSLYVHVPFCRSRCPYCAFNSAVPASGEIEAYLAGLDRELSFFREISAVPLRARTIYIGGGTPSILTVSQWERLFLSLESNVDLSEVEEFSVEANPESLEVDHLSLWRERAVSRVSVGVQSLDDGELKWLGRLHDAARARWAVASSLEAGFDVSGDLIFGLRDQTVRKWHESLSGMVELGLEHISLYQLTIEEDSRWGRTPPAGVRDGYGHYRWAQWYLPRMGFQQYEIASFARGEKWSRHNMAYWRRDSVLGIGPGAWGFLGGLRYGNICDLPSYLEALKGGEAAMYTERVSGFAEASEAAILALRTSSGIDLGWFRTDFGDDAADRLEREIGEFPPSCVDRREGAIRLSPKGMRIANSLWERLLWGD